MRLSLRGRGVAALLAVSIYILAGALAINSEREYLRSLALELEQAHDKDTALGKTSHALYHAVIRAKELMAAGGLDGSGADDLALDLELVHAGLVVAVRHSATLAPEIDRVERLMYELRNDPQPELLNTVDQLGDDLDKTLSVVDSELHEARGGIWQRYHEAYDRMTLVGFFVNLVGVIVFGALVTLFFSRLTWDIQKVKSRAAAIVGGYRGPPLPVTRGDEVGDLMTAINHTQTELREREQKLEIARETQFHREKMAAMGSLASAVAHEINNPIAAIVGVAQAMAAAQQAGRDATAGVIKDGPDMILQQAQRVAGISRQIAEFTRPPAEKPAMIDVNAVMRSTCRFAQYDRRLRSVHIDLVLDPALPGVFAVADHLTQVLMNVLINAADALAGMGDRRPKIRIETSLAGEELVMKVIDNGRGMDAATLERAFDEAFTTKPADTGRGLGLFLCRELLQRHGGHIDVDSRLGEGTTVTVRHPIRPLPGAKEAPCRS